MTVYLPRSLFDQGEDALWNQEADDLIAATQENLSWEQQAGDLIRGVGDQLGAIFNPRPVQQPQPTRSLMVPADREDRLNRYQPQEPTFPSADELFRTVAPEWAEPEPPEQAASGPGMASWEPSTAGAGAPSPQAPAVAAGGDIEGYIRQAAAARGIDPDIAVKVANSEGGVTEPARRGTFATGSSWWPFQLHYGGAGYESLGDTAGLGNDFTKQTGIQPGDPNGWKAATDFALDQVARNGWGAWYGAKAQGITGRMGVAENAQPRGIGEALADAGQAVGSGFARAGEAIGGALQGPADAIRGAGRALGIGDLTPDQSTLDDPDKWALCGPVAAMAFARANGREPTLAEAKQLAIESGWTAEAGMAGLGSEVTLLGKLGIAAKIGSADQETISADVRNGNPVIISTPNHYFVAERVDDQGRFYVGNSGTVYRGGSKWMSLEQISALGGGIQGAAYMDNPTSPTPSVATIPDYPGTIPGLSRDIPEKGANLPGRQAANPWNLGQVGETLGRTWDAAGHLAGDLSGAATSRLNQASDGLTSILNQGADEAVPAVSGALETIGDSPVLPLNIIKPGGGLAGVANAVTGREEDEGQWWRLREIDDFAREHGYVNSFDRRFQQDYPDLAAEDRDLMNKQTQAVGMQFSMGGAGRGVEMLGDAARGAAPQLPGAIRRAGEFLGGLRDAGAALTRGLPGGAPAANIVPESGRNPVILAMDQQLERDLGVFPQRAGDPRGTTRLDPETGRLVDVTYNRFNNAEVVPGSDRPLDFVYRAVSGDELRRIQETGAIRSDGRMNVLDSEGTVAKAIEPPVYYLPQQGEGHILKIKVDPADGWRIDSADGYVKTNRPIPADRIVATSRFLDGKAAAPDPTLVAEADRLGSAVVPPEGSQTAGALQRMGGQALGGGIAGGYAASQEEGADLGSVARGAGLGAVGGVARGALSGRGGRQILARAVAQGADEVPDGPAPTPIRQQMRGQPRQERAAELSRPITLTEPEQISRIRLDKFPEELRDDLLNAARGTGFGERLRRGVLSDDAVQTLAAEYAPTVESAIATSRRGRAYSAEEIVALRNLMVGQSERTKSLATDLTEGSMTNAERLGAQAQLAMEQQKLALLGDVVFGGAPAEAGRALRQFRQAAQSLEVDPGAAGLRYLKQQFGTLDKAEEVTAKYLTMVQSGAGPIELAKYLKGAKGDWLNRLGIVRYASMLSSTTTHAINATGNALMQGVDLATLPIAAGIDVARVAGARVIGRQAQREIFFSEIPARLHGMTSGVATGIQDAAFIMRHGLRPEDVTKLDHLRQGFGTDIPVLAPRGTGRAEAVDFIIEGPLRSLSAADAVFRSAAMSGHLASEGTAKILRSGGKATPEALARAMDDPKVIERADELSKRSVLQEENFGRDLANRIRGMSGAGRAVTEALMPFIATPYSIISQGVGMTPAGLAKAVMDARAGKGARNVEETLGRVALGTAVMSVAASQYLAGNLTGPRPEDEAERSTLPPGWREWSFKTTLPNGETRYFPLAGLGPLAVPPVVAILSVEAQKQGKAANPAEIAVGIAQFASDQTFLRGIGDFSKAITEGGVKIENFVEGLATQYSPHFLGGGALGRQIQAVMGQPLRDPQGAVQAILATLPYGDAVSEKSGAGRIPLRRDVLGRPQKTAPGGVESAISPFRATVERDTPLIAAYRRVGEGLPTRAPKSVRNPDTDRAMVLSTQQQDRWRVAFGASLQRFWQENDRPTDAEVLRKIEQQARDEAALTVLGR